MEEGGKNGAALPDRNPLELRARAERMGSFRDH
jgi:hypothetical protein